MTRPSNPHLPEKILATAERMVVAEGHQALQMRTLAAEVGVTPTTLYYYFRSKQEILAQLKLRGAAKLQATMSGIDWDGDSVSAIRALGEAYIAFAEENPHLYKLLTEVSLGKAAFAAADFASMTTAFHIARHLLEKLVTQGKLDCTPRHRAMIGWVLLHGFSSLLIAGTLESVSGMERAELREAFLNFYSVGPAQGDPAPDA